MRAPEEHRVRGRGPHPRSGRTIFATAVASATSGPTHALRVALRTYGAAVRRRPTSDAFDAPNRGRRRRATSTGDRQRVRGPAAERLPPSRVGRRRAFKLKLYRRGERVSLTSVMPSTDQPRGHRGRRATRTRSVPLGAEPDLDLRLRPGASGTGDHRPGRQPGPRLHRGLGAARRGRIRRGLVRATSPRTMA